MPILKATHNIFDKCSIGYVYSRSYVYSRVYSIKEKKMLDLLTPQDLEPAAPVSLLRTTRSSQVSGPIGSERLRRAVVAKGQQTRKLLLLLLLPQALLYVVLHNVVQMNVYSMYSLVKILGLHSSLVVLIDII
jgi:hypothetical protein